MSPGPTLKYAVGDCAKCYWGSGQYTAKVVAVDRSQKEAPYLVHYQGWKSRWDEWVPESRLTGPGTGHKQKPMTSAPAKRSAPNSKQKAVSSASSSLKFTNRDPELMRILDGSKIVYVNEKNQKFKTINEVKRYCTQHGFSFESSAYDFSLPLLSLLSPKEESKGSKQPKTKSSNTRKSKIGNKATKTQEKIELVSEVRQIQKGLDVKGPAPPKRAKKTLAARTTDLRGSIEMVNVDSKPPNVIVEPIEEPGDYCPDSGDDFSQIGGRPSRHRRPNQKYLDLPTELEAKKQKRTFSNNMEDAPFSLPTDPLVVHSIKTEIASTKEKFQTKTKKAKKESKGLKSPKSKVKTKLAPKKPAVSCSARFEEQTLSDEDEGSESGGAPLPFMMPELEAEETTEFIEIQEPEPMVSDAPKSGNNRACSNKSIKTAKKVIGARKSTNKRNPSILEEHHPEEHFPHMNFGMPQDDDDLAGLHEDLNRFFVPQVEMEPSVVESQHSVHETLRGIKVTGTAPPAEAPSRVFMKLKGPDPKKSTRYKAAMPSLRIGPDGLEYIDSAYSPSLHVGGRGHFGVVGSGQPLPQPVIQEKRENFCILPQEIVGDHCYGKTPPPAGGAHVSAKVTSHLIPTSVGQMGRRIAVTGFGPLRGSTIRVLPRRSPSPLTFRESSVAASALAESDGFYEDEILDEDLATYGQMVGFSDSPGPAEHHQSTSISSTVTLMPPQRQNSMLSDNKLPANILEGVDDSDLP